MPTKPKQNNILLMILIAVAGVVALLLLLDAFLPILPDSIDRPDAHESTSDSTDAVGAETKKHWWEGIFDKKEPDPDSDPDTSNELTYYTEEEMWAWYDDLEKTFYSIAEQGYEWGTAAFGDVGLFDLDVDGTPEVIAVNNQNGGFCYLVFDMTSGELKGVLEAGSAANGLWLYRQNGGDGFHILFDYAYSPSLTQSSSRPSKTEYRNTVSYEKGTLTVQEILSCTSAGYTNNLGEYIPLTTYAVCGEFATLPQYEEYVAEFFKDLTELNECAMITVGCEPSVRPDGIIKNLLSTGQKFIRNDKTLP